jgi:oligopeptidase B
MNTNSIVTANLAFVKGVCFMKNPISRRNLLSQVSLVTFVASTGIAATPLFAKPQGTIMSKLTAPKPKKIPFTIEQLGIKRTDNYHWMKDNNWQAVLRDPDLIKAEVKDHLIIENKYTKDMLASTQALQDEMFAEMKARIKEDDSSVPSPDGPYDYYTRYNKGEQYPIHARRPRLKGKFGTQYPELGTITPDEVILLNENKRAEGKDYYETGTSTNSPDHSLYAWAEDTQGSEFYTVFVKNIASGEMIGKPIEACYGSFAFSPDGKFIFWTFRDENGRPSKIFRRPVGGIGIGVTGSQSFMTIGIGNQDTSETWLIPAETPTAAPVCVAKRVTGVQYDINHWGDRFIILTDMDGAADFKVMESTAKMPTKETWKEIIPHRPGIYITGLGTFKSHMVRLEKENANSRIVITQKSDRKEHIIDVNEEAYALGLLGSSEYDTTVMRYSYTSPTTPASIYDYDMTSREKVLRKTQIVPSGHNPADYVAKRLYAKADDGAEIPITVLMKKGTPLDGSAPLLLYGYGSYGISMEPTFSTTRLSLVNRGWIWAIAHVRGGSEKGRNWFFEGRKFKKKNTFTDFIDCAEHLTAKGYGTKGKIVAYGGSAGGLLMGAITNMRPDLWAGVIGAVPFVDVLNTMSDTSLPLTPPEWPEWGNPIEDKVAYDYIVSYSPYDQVKAQAYPPVLATGGLSDPRVTYWEPMKWIAKLREYSTSGAPMLLKINMEAGHGGASGRFDYLKEIAFDFSFAIFAHDKGWTK